MSKVVIGDAVVTRYNGNNPTGARAERLVDRREIRKEKIRKWSKTKAKRWAKESEYARRYLGG